MGLKGGHKDISFSIKNVSLETLVMIAKQRLKNNNRRNSNDISNPIKPVIDIDASFVLRSNSANLGDRNPVQYLFQLSKVFAEASFDVYIIFDGDVRHHSKRSTTKRLADCHRNIISIQHDQSKLLELRNNIDKNNNTIDEIIEMKNQRDDLTKKIIRKEKSFEKTNINVGEISYEQIQNLVLKYDDITLKKKKGGSLKLIKATQQADSVLAYRCESGQSDIMLCPDSDMLVLTGSKCLCIKTFRFNDSSKKKIVSNIELFYASNETVIDLNINTYMNNSNTITPKYPIFGMTDDIRLRSLMSIGIGCDVYLNGVPSITSKTIFEMLHAMFENEQASSYNTYEWFVNSYVERWKRSHEFVKSDVEINQYKTMINVLVDTIVYEPCHHEEENIALYLHDHPMILHPYIESFGNQNNNICISPASIDDCNDLFLCVGPGTYSHYVFIQECDLRKCNNCQSSICMTCSFNINESKDYCVRCFGQETSLINSEKVKYLPLNLMIKELRKKGMLLNNNEDYDFVLDIYQAHETYKTLFGQNDFYKVKFPLEKTTYIKNMNIISSFNISEGGSFLNNEKIEFQTKMEMLEILISIVTNKKDEVNANSNKDTYNIFSNLMISFAMNSRIHDGSRLLKRAIRHALDHDAIDIIKAKGNIVRYKNKCAIHLKHDVKASMKSNTYCAEIIFNNQSIIACTCSCKCGSLFNERIICVHILPIIYQLSMLMYNGLAKDILFEMDIFLYKKKHESNTKEHLRFLILSLFDIIKYNDDIKQSSNNIDDMLSDFRVGTEKPKFGPGLPFDPSKIGPISSLDLRSVKKRAQDMINKSDKKENQLVNEIISQSITSTKLIDENTYTDIVMCIIAICNIAKISHEDRIKCFNQTIGYKLLLHRSKCVSWTDKVPINIVRSMKNLLNLGSKRDRANVRPTRIEKNTVSKFIGVSEKSKRNMSTKLIKKYNKRRCCCACSRTNTKFPNLKFRTIPRIDRISKNVTTNRIRLSLAKKIKRREVILDRFGIFGESRNNKYLQFCDHHDYVEELIIVDWIDQDGIIRKSRCKLQLLQPYDKDLQFDCYLNNNNNDNNYNLENDASFNGIVFWNENEIVKVIDRNDKSNCYDDYAIVSDNFMKEDRKHRKQINSHNILYNDSESESSYDSLYDDDDNDEMIDDHLLLYNSNNIIIHNIDNDKIMKINNGLDEDLFYEQEMIQYVPKGNSVCKCNYKDCHTKSDENTIIMKSIPFIRKSTRSSLTVNRNIRQYAIRLAYRKECLNRIGVDDNDFSHQQPIRICNKHEIIEEEMYVEWIDKKGLSIKEKITANLPIQYIPSSLLTNKRPNKGCGQHRWLLNQLYTANDNKENSNDLVNRNEMISLQRVYGLENNDDNNKEISSLVKDAIGLFNTWKRYNLPLIITNDKIKEEVDIDDEYENNKMKTKMRIHQLLKKNNNKKVMKLVKVRTGFNSALDLVSFIIIACNGNMESIIQRDTKLSWFEEWCLYFGVAMGKNIDRWCDAEDKYHVSERTCRRVFDNKQKLVLAVRLYWPTYATFDEDHLFRSRNESNVVPYDDGNGKNSTDNNVPVDGNEKNDNHVLDNVVQVVVEKRDEYDNMRIVMWDNTNVDMCQPSAAEAQRLTYSAYYAGNVAKGGIFVQLCNWIGTHPLWTGAVSDTEYLVKSGILQQQEKYIQQYDQSRSDISWTNILDRGYKVTQQAWSTGNQLVLQPVNAPTGRRFNTSETLLAAGVAAVRANNERAVKRVKTSAYLAHGQRTHESVERLNDMWLAYGFMMNFMTGTD